MKALTLVLFLFIMPVANAGWWSNFCEKHLIADDPYQFQELPKAWLEWKQHELSIKRNWGKANKAELSMLKIIERELRSRE